VVEGCKEQEVGMPQEQTLELTARKKSDQEDPPRKKHQYWWKDSAETACWSTKHRRCSEEQLGDQPQPSQTENDSRWPIRSHVQVFPWPAQ